MAYNISSKGKIALAGLAGLFVVGAYGLWSAVPDNWKSAASSVVAPGGDTIAIESSEEAIDVCVVTWGGYAGGQYFNRGFKPSDASLYKQRYNLTVNFHVIDDFNASREAYKAGDCDLLWATIDAFTTEAATLQKAGFNPKFLFQADWSRGGDAIVAGPGIKSMSDLRGKRVAVAFGTPSHTFLLRMLEAAGMTTSDLTIIDTGNAIDAAKAFQTGNAEAAVVWSPDDTASVNAVPGSTVMISTREASHIIADGFIAEANYIESHREELRALIEGWMIGAGDINSNAAAKTEASNILATGLNIPAADALAAINNVRLTTLGDNRQFFGLESGATMTGERLFTASARLYQQNGYTSLVPEIPAWRSITDISLLSGVNLNTPNQAAEGRTSFAQADTSAASAQAIASRGLSVQFATGSATLSDEAKAVIMREFVQGTGDSFAGARVRIEGNTDNTGSRTTNVTLSQRRAEAVANFLVTLGFDRNRFVVVGNGPDKPVCNSQDAACMAQNRRTDFELIR